jgi:Cu(I)/Ag(I) efflux system membrane fusion protein/cobalt-zinc-cadmium efflux system membrane fusion protein
MGMDLVPVYEEEGEEKEPSSNIRIDPVTAQNMGLRLGTVQKKRLSKYIRTYGNVSYNETKVYTVNTKFNGWIEKLHVDFLGEHVEKGQALFEIYSPDLFAAQQEYLSAYLRYKSLSPKTSKSVENSAKGLMKAARTRLIYWDLGDEQIQDIEKTGEIKKTLTIFSPATGVVIKKNAFEGHYVKAGIHQFEIADLSEVWVDVDIYEYEFPWVKKGMPADMELAYIPGKVFKGEVLFIYPYLSVKTRTARLRLAFKNPESELKPGMYANIYLKAELPDEVVVIPQEAVIDSGVRKVVFVSLGKGKFQPRNVKLGVEGNSHEFQVIEGLEEGDKIVLSGQFLLDSESRLREAIQKMLDAKMGKKLSDESSTDDLNMDDLDMKSDDDLDMSDINMDEDKKEIQTPTEPTK